MLRRWHRRIQGYFQGHDAPSWEEFEWCLEQADGYLKWEDPCWIGTSDHFEARAFAVLLS